MKVKPEIGLKYSVSTKNGSHFQGRYMGKDYADRLLFDLRPVSGTTTVEPDDVLKCEPVA